MTTILLTDSTGTHAHTDAGFAQLHSTAASLLITWLSCFILQFSVPLSCMHMLNWCLLSATNVDPRTGTVPSFLRRSSHRLLLALALLRAGCCAQRPNGLPHHSRQENFSLLETEGWYSISQEHAAALRGALPCWARAFCAGASVLAISSPYPYTLIDIATVVVSVLCAWSCIAW